MKAHWLTTLGLGMALALTASISMAEKDKDKHHGNPHANKFDDDDRNWDRRDGYEYRSYESREQLPPGWDHGKKTGWGNCGMPPGQAKKYGCRSYVYEGRPHYYYQDDHGRVYVRRPIIEIHGSVDIVR